MVKQIKLASQTNIETLLPLIHRVISMTDWEGYRTIRCLTTVYKIFYMDIKKMIHRIAGFQPNNSPT